MRVIIFTENDDVINVDEAYFANMLMKYVI